MPGIGLMVTLLKYPGCHALGIAKESVSNYKTATCTNAMQRHGSDLDVPIFGKKW